MRIKNTKRSPLTWVLFFPTHVLIEHLHAIITDAYLEEEVKRLEHQKNGQARERVGYGLGVNVVPDFMSAL